MDEADYGNLFAERYLAGAIARARVGNYHRQRNYHRWVVFARGDCPSQCEDCGAVIPIERRDAVPGVRLCIECQREMEDL